MPIIVLRFADSVNVGYRLVPTAPIPFYFRADQSYLQGEGPGSHPWLLKIWFEDGMWKYTTPGVDTCYAISSGMSIPFGEDRQLTVLQACP